MSVPEVLSREDKEPILIVDKNGQIGERLSEKLKSEATIVFVSQERPKLDDLIHIPFDKKFPQIPDNTYSHIFVIDDGSSATRESLASYLEKAENDNAVFLFAAHMREINEKLINDLTSYYQKAKILFSGDLFAAGPVDKDSYIVKFFAQARLKNKILVPGDGTAVTYPVFFDDFIAAILEAVFGQSNEKVFYAFPKYPPTLLSLARMIRKANPHIGQDFSKEEGHKPPVILPDGKYLLDENYPLDARIREVKIEEKTYNTEEENDDEVGEPKSSGVKFPRWGFLTIFILLLLPLISTLLLSFLGAASLRGMEFYLDRGDFEKGQKSAFFSRTYFELANKTALVPIFTDLLKEGEKAAGASFVLEGLAAKDFSEVKKGLAVLQKEKINYPMINFAAATIDSWEDLLGFREKRKYLLLLLDQNELRPTGGIIDSFSVLTLDKVNLLPFELKDSALPDAKAKGQVEPPYPLRRYLNSTSLLFKDSSFNVDFANSASSSAVLLSVLENEKVDGVVALDKGLYEKLSEDFKRNASYKNFLEDIEEGIIRKQILFAFNDQNLQNIFTANGWSSALWDARPETGAGFNDFLGINEANLSRNKIGKSIKRNIAHDVKISEEGVLTSVLTISYKNDSKESYKNYLRLILPQDSEINELRINDRAIETRSAIKDPQVYEARNFREPEELELDEENQSGKTVFGFYLEIAAEAVEEVQITYTLAKEVDPENHISYNLRIFKQPYLDFPYEFSFFYPEDFKITSGTKNLKKEIIKDETILIELSKI